MREDDSDAALWLEAVSGTERAFVVIFGRYRTRVFRAAYRRSLDVSQAEEVVRIDSVVRWAGSEEPVVD